MKKHPSGDAAATGAPQVVLRPLAELVAYARNARTHDAAQVSQLKASMVEFGWTNPVLADTAGIVAGHGRTMAAGELYAAGVTIRFPNGAPIPAGMVPVIDCTGWSDAQRKAYILTDNKLALNAGWDLDMLRVEIGDLQSMGFDLTLTGFDDEEIGLMLGDPADDGGADEKEEGPTVRGALAERFGIAPFSVLNARNKWWQNRKEAWMSLGIQSEIGRGGKPRGAADAKAYEVGTAIGLGGLAEQMVAGLVVNRKAKPKASAPGLTYVRGNRDVTRADLDEVSQEILRTTSGSSIFDPVMCELAYRWFSPIGGTILDPFAGGSVRGIVAARLGREYVGCELRTEQVEANRVQAAAICATGAMPTWVIGDSAVTIPALDDAADFIFTCPPYGDLEVYSDRPDDLSAMDHKAFLVAYRTIIAAAVSKLRMDRFACIVVGDFRDAKGFYRNFVSDTIAAFEDAGASLYNEAILVTRTGSLAIRTGKQFVASRKLGKTHQNVLVFCKGDPRKATEACGEVEFGEIDGVDIESA